MRSIGLLFLVSVVAFGQRVNAGGSGNVHANGSARPNGFGSVSGFGNVVFPGTGHAPVGNHGVTSFTGARVGRRAGGGAVVYVPYSVGYPVGYPGYGYAEQGPPPVTMVYPQQQLAPQVVINQNFVSDTARPIVREYATDASGGIRVYEPQRPVEAQTQAPVPENPTYLIAFKDHTIYAAVAYWVEDGTLHYVTNQNTHNQVSLDLVDRELSDRLNQERGIELRLPARR
jgi:hypothetical protein